MIDVLNIEAQEMKEFISGMLDTASELVAEESYIAAMDIMAQAAADIDTLPFICEEDELPDLSDINERIVLLGELITMAIEQKEASQTQAA